MVPSSAVSGERVGVTTTLCPFCRIAREGSEEIRGFGSMMAFLDAYPVSQGHFLVVPRRHLADCFDLDEQEVQDCARALRELRAELLGNDSTITGFNVGVNSGVAAGQTVEHAHVHLIPRRAGDTPDPRGGVRGVIPDKMSY